MKDASHKPLLLLSLLASMLLGDALAYGDGEQPLFVAVGGVDSGRCRDAARPCESIAYALQRIGKGGQLRVAAGSYEIGDAATLFQLVSGDIDIRGGYAADRNMAAISAAASILIGVPPQFAPALSRRGFHVVVDRKGFDRGLATPSNKLLAEHERLESSLAAAPCTAGSVNGLPCSNVDLLSHVGLADISAQPGTAADVWGFVDLNSNREYAIVGFRNGTAVFDVTNADNPREVGFIDGQRTTWRDIKVYQYWNVAESRWNAVAYVTTDGSSDGLFVVDLGSLPHRIQQLGYSSDFTAAHNIHVTSTDLGTGLALNDATPTLIVAGSNIADGPYRAYTIATPAAPVFEVMPGSGRSDYTHDAASMLITDNRKDTQCINGAAYCEVLFDFNESTIDIWDITDTGNPVRLSRTTYSNAEYVHSGWWSEDRQFLFVHDELDEPNFMLNSTVRVFSLANLGLPTLVGSWTGPTHAIDHNGFARGNRYYLSNYSEGLTILDITDAANPVRVGFLDTYPASSSSSFVGAWGVYPFFHSGNVALSDMSSGFYMVADRTLDVPQGALGLSAASYGGDEGSTLLVDVVRTGGSMDAVSVGYEIVPATGNSLDIDVPGGVIAWSDGDSSNKTIAIDLLVDAEAEQLERLLLRLVAPTGGATLGTARVASIYVGEAGAAASLGFDRDAIAIAERGFGTAVAVVRRSGSARGAASVDFAMTSGNADSGVDFSGPTSGTLAWADGDADPKWIEFAIADDGSGEVDEFFELALENAAGATIGAAATLRIVIADGMGSNAAPNAVAGASQTVASGAAVTLDGSQSNDPDGDVVDYQWTQLTGPSVTLDGADSAIATFSAPNVASDTLLQFQLSVSDPGGLFNTATTAVTVRKSVGGRSSGSGGGSADWLLVVLLLVVAYHPCGKLFARN